MGCTASKKSQAEVELEARIKGVVAKVAKSPNRQIKGFDNVILKFPAIRTAFKSIRSVFSNADTNGDGFIDRAELLVCVKSFGSTATDHDLDVIFEGSDMSSTGRLTFKNFLLCLALASVLDLLPGLRVATTADEEDTAASESKSGEVHPEAPATEDGEFNGPQLVQALTYVLETYILFDEDGSGYIDRDEVMAMLKEKSTHATSKGGSSALLSQQRWNEMDWDKDGTITFKEFLAATYSWVGLDADDE